MSSNKQMSSHNNHIPLHFKIIIIVQAAVILAFTVGMYQEYLNNLYLQAYVLSLFSTNIVADVMLSMVTVSVFAIGTFTLLGSMSSTRRANKEWDVLSQPLEEEMEMPLMPVLETTSPASIRKKSATRRSRPRRSRIDNDDIYRSMTQYASKQEDMVSDR